MLYAKLPTSDQQVRALPGGRAICPGCNARVIAKCGEINAWHWAHEAGADCDPWSEGESSWHLAWKSRADASRCEVVVGRHRADIVSPSGIVIELQHSPLKPGQVREREGFYRDMIWLVDGFDFRQRFHVQSGLKGDTCRFVWPNARKWLYAVTKPLYLDFRDSRIFFVDRLNPNVPATYRDVTYDAHGDKSVDTDGKACNGTGWYLTAEQFTARWIRPKAAPVTDWEAHKRLRNDDRPAIPADRTAGFLPFGDQE